MFQVAVYGSNDLSAAIRQHIEDEYDRMILLAGGEPLKVIAYFDVPYAEERMHGDLPVLEFLQMRSLYEKGVINGIIIPRELFAGQTNILSFITHNGIDIRDIYLTERIAGIEDNEEYWHTFLSSYLSSKYLPYLEFHIADHCNLNCKACEHYSGLAAPRYPDLEKFINDMYKLHGFISDIGVIRILGGEPLLNPEIDAYIKLTRTLYPKSMINVVTNALLLRQMPEHFFETMRETGAKLNISFYPPLREKMPEIVSFLKSKGIPGSVSPLLDKFEMKQSLKKSPTPEYFYRCFQAHCHNLYDGKIAACFLPFTTKYFNQYFDKHLPEDGAIDLYDHELTTESLQEKLMQPFERCCYCTDAVSVDWAQISNPSILTDWVKEEI